MSMFRYSTEVSDAVRKKIKIFVILVVVAFLCLWMRVWYLQILKGQYFREMSENNRVRMVSLPAYRGTIKDRNGETLVSIRPSFNLYITPEDAANLDETLDLISEKVSFDEEKLRQEIRNARPFKDVLIRADISRAQVAFVEENKMQLHGVHIKAEPLRSYVHQDMAAHVLGYVGEISKDRLEKLKGSSYRLGDMVGKDGLEFIYESMLQGEKGYKEVEVDVSGRELKTLRKLPPESGDDLVLTLDVRVQKALERLMEGTPEKPLNGSAVVMKVHTGEIIAVISKPSFDANLFAAGISREKWRELVRDELHPLQNRVINGLYPPGSTYKMVVALAGLEEEIITPETSIYCPGHFRLGRGIYRCWKRGGHGAMNLHDALVQSCDVYFYTLGHRLGIDTINKYALEFGLGDYTGIRLSGEKAGLIPSREWKRKKKKEPWLPGETISASIGQGYNLVTPIQQVNLMASLANGGMLLRPHLVKRIQHPSGKVIKEFFPHIVRRIDVDPEHLELIQTALLDVVNGRKGTGRRARLEDIPVSGKTGTAQVVHIRVTQDVEPEEEVPYQYRDHAWFLAYAPFKKPEIAVAVLVEHGGHGGTAAAPIAREIIRTYFKYYPLDSSFIGKDRPGSFNTLQENE